MGWFDSGVKTKKVDLLSAKERKAKDYAAEYLRRSLTAGAEAYGGQLTAGIPDLFGQAYDWYAGQFGREDIDAATKDLIAGKPAYTYDPIATSERWQEQFATPVMEAWRQTVLPSVRESFNTPGNLYSTGASRGTLREAGNYFGQYVQPALYGAHMAGEQMGFQSAESAAARQPGALGLPAQQFGEAATAASMMRAMEQQGLSAEYQEFLRQTKQEQDWAALISGISPSMESYGIATPSDRDKVSQIGGMAMGGAMAFG